MIGNHRQMKNQPDQSCLLHATSLCTMSGCSVLISCSLSTKVLFALIPSDDADVYSRNAATIRVKARASWWGQCALVQKSLRTTVLDLLLGSSNISILLWRYYPSSVHFQIISFKILNPDLIRLLLLKKTSTFFTSKLYLLSLKNVTSLVSPLSCTPFRSFLQILLITHRKWRSHFSFI